MNGDATWQTKLARRLVPVVAGLLAVAALLLMLGEGVHKPGGHDENQFVVPGFLTIERGLLPYRDYALFHTPILVLMNGWLATLSEYRLLWPRLLAVTSVWLTVCLVAWRAAHRFASAGRAVRFVAALLAGVALLFAPTTALAASLSWNHGPPVLCMIAAFCLHFSAAEAGRHGWRIFFGGFCIGLAIAMRVSFLPLLAPFGLSALALGRGWDAKWRLALLFPAGALLALAPVIALWMAAPDAFYFGVFRYPRLSLVWRKYPFWAENIAQFVDPERGLLVTNDPAFGGRPLANKLEFFWRKSLPGHFPLWLAAVVIGLPGCVRALWKSRARAHVAWLLVGALPFVWWGCVAPSRFNPQYYYAITPVLVLLAVEGAAWLCQVRALRVVVPVVAALAAGAMPWLGRELFATAQRLPDFEQWGIVATHRAGVHVRRLTPPGHLLTLEPLIALEAGREVYPELANGEFGWRCAHLLPARDRQRFHLPAPQDLAALMAQRPPAAIYLKKGGGKLNRPLERLAAEKGFVTAWQNSGTTLYRAPAPGPGADGPRQ